MGGTPTIPDPNQQLNQDPTQQLEQQAGQAQSRLGSALQQQQAPASLAQQPQTDPLESLKQSLAQQYQQQQQPEQTGGPIKRLLSNFFQGAGQAMQHEAGVPTQYEKQQRTLQNLTNVTNTQAMLRLHEGMASMYGSQPIQMPDGSTQMVPNNQLGRVLSGMMQAQAHVAGAQIGATAKMNLGQLQLAISQGAIGRIEPAQDENGNFVQRAYNKYGQPIGDLQGALPPTQYLSKMSTTQDFKQDENGNIIAIPKTTTTTPIMPGGPLAGKPVSSILSSPSGTPTNAPVSSAPPGSRIVGHGKAVGMVSGTDAQGNQVAGTPEELRSAGVNQFTNLPASESGKVTIARQLTSPNGLFGLIDKDLAQFRPGELEALSPRWNEFLAGTVGTVDPRYIALRTHVNGLLSTALMQAHIGTRGGSNLMEHFQDIANAGKMSLPTLKAALGAERSYVEEKAMRPRLPGATPQPTSGGGRLSPTEWLQQGR